MTEDNKHKAIFLDRDGVVNVERSYIRKPGEFVLYPFTAKAIKKINDSGFLAIVVSNQSAIARNMCTVDEVEIVHDKLKQELKKEGAFVDAIYYCPHHPGVDMRTGNPEYIKDCECRKPKTGLFEMAAKDFKINRKESWMIGDSNRDILAGKTFGCKTIGVLTGHGKNGFEEQPDFVAENLLDAIRVISPEPPFYKSVKA